MNDATEVDRLAVNAIRVLAIEGVEKAKSGHPGLPLGAAPMAHVLWSRHLRYDPADPAWPDRDRFILSAGHGSMLLYALLHVAGYDLSLDDIEHFRQWGSRTPGHPEYGHTPGVEVTTGPLGQGFANGVGMAMAEAFLAATFNRPGHEVVAHRVYGIVGDGDLMEGISSEAASLAGHLGLGRLIYLYDDNHISIEGSTEIAFSEDRMARFRAYGWHTQSVADGNDLEAIAAAIEAAQAVTDQPSIIAIRTHIGYGSPNKQDSASSHGEPLGEEEVLLAKQNLGWPAEPAFLIPDDVLAYFRQALAQGAEREAAWQAKFAAYAAEYPELAAEWQRRLARQLPEDWDADVPAFSPDPKGAATRNSAGAVLNGLAKRLPELIGGSADLAPSTKTLMKGTGNFQAGAYQNRNMHFGVREHGMAGILNGMALYGGLRPFGATFMVFSDYCRPSIRLASMMEAPVVYVFTHDSIGVGEDGPTHQPVEQLAALRTIPGLVVIRPADARESAAAWRYVIAEAKGPVALALTRQNVPIYASTAATPEEGLGKGAYIVADWPEDASDQRVILIGTGSELQLAMAAREKLAEKGVAARVVSMPSWELFEAQFQSYKNEVLPPDVTARVSIEAGVSMGWDRYVGSAGAIIALDRFGASSPFQTAMTNLGFSVDNVVGKALGLLA